MIVRANPHSHPRRESVLLRNGVVGYQLPELHVSVFPIAAGDLVVFQDEQASIALVKSHTRLGDFAQVMTQAGDGDHKASCCLQSFRATTAVSSS